MLNGDRFYASLLERLRADLAPQPDKPDETPEATLKALVLTAAGTPMSARKAMETDLPTLSEDGRATLGLLVEKRLAGVPLAHITGRQHFMGLEMLAGPDALIPRVETEILGEAALSCTRERADAQGSVRVLDVCSGSGNLALSLAVQEPRCRVFGSDLSPAAVALAVRNADHLGVSNRTRFASGDLFEAWMSDDYYAAFDIVTCNPPYISSAKVGTMPEEISRHEPRLAFDGGVLGITLLTRLIREAPRFLKPGGYLCFEVGLGQGPHMVRMLENSKLYLAVQTHSDATNHVRAVVARV